MKASKILLLFLLLAFGGLLEVSWRVRNRVDLGPSGCRVLSGRFYGPSFTYEASREIPLPEGTALEVTNAFGAVRVHPGEAGRTVVGLKKVVYREDEAEARAFADRVVLEQALESGTLRLSTNRERLEREGDEVGFETHLDVAVPPATAVVVRNEHGVVSVTGVARADVEASFGEVSVSDVAGDARVVGAHEAVSALRVGGELTLEARHGEVTVEDVGGGARLSVQHDDVHVARTGALRLQLRHGSAEVDTVRGDLELEGSFAGLTAREVEGRAVVETSQLAVELEDVTGPVEATVERGSFRGAGLRGGAKVRASGEVSLERFAGAIDVESTRADVTLEPGTALVAPLTARTGAGTIELTVPPGSRFVLQAASERGEVEADLPGLRASREDRGATATGEVGGGGEVVRLEARRGDVRVRPGPALADPPVAEAPPAGPARPAQGTPPPSAPAPASPPAEAGAGETR